VATLNFSDAELSCRHGCGGLPSEEFQAELQKLRSVWSKPLGVSSAFRCAVHNQAVSSTGPTGPHTRGAVDLLVPSDQVYQFLYLAILMGWRGIGIHQHGTHAGRFVHIDRLPERGKGVVWSYPTSNSRDGEKIEC
jgi:hypothetical protein